MSQKGNIWHLCCLIFLKSFLWLKITSNWNQIQAFIRNINDYEYKKVWFLNYYWSEWNKPRPLLWYNYDLQKVLLFLAPVLTNITPDTQTRKETNITLKSDYLVHIDGDGDDDIKQVSQCQAANQHIGSIPHAFVPVYYPEQRWVANDPHHEDQAGNDGVHILEGMFDLCWLYTHWGGRAPRAGRLWRRKLDRHVALGGLQGVRNALRVTSKPRSSGFHGHQEAQQHNGSHLDKALQGHDNSRVHQVLRRVCPNCREGASSIVLKKTQQFVAWV